METQTEANNNVRDYLNREFNAFIEPEKIGFFSKSNDKLYHNGKPISVHCHNFNNLPEREKQAIAEMVNKAAQLLEDYDGGDDGEAWSGGFADNH